MSAWCTKVKQDTSQDLPEQVGQSSTGRSKIDSVTYVSKHYPNGKHGKPPNTTAMLQQSCSNSYASVVDIIPVVFALYCRGYHSFSLPLFDLLCV